MKRTHVLASLAVLLLGTPPARAEHFDIHLVVKGPGGQAESRWDTTPPVDGLNPRPVLRAAPGETLTLDWSIRSEFPHGVLKDVRVRVFVARKQPGEQVPPPGAPRLVDNAFTTDFLPRHKARGRVRFRVKEPGLYLVALESSGTLKEHGHEHFSAIDVRVE